MEKIEQRRDWEPERIRKAVTSKGVPIEELAELWGVPKSSIYKAFSCEGYQNCEPYIAGYVGFPVDVIWAARVAARQEKAARRARALLEAKAVAARQVA